MRCFRYDFEIFSKSFQRPLQLLPQGNMSAVFIEDLNKFKVKLRKDYTFINDVSHNICMRRTRLLSNFQPRCGLHCFAMEENAKWPHK